MENQLINVLITRPPAGLGSALHMLPSNRFHVYPCPTVTIHPVPQDPGLDEIFNRIAEFDFLVFTSQIAVIETFEYMRRIRIDPRQLYRLSVCAVGPVVSQQLNRFGLTANVMPNKYTAQALADLFPVMRTHSPKVLFPRGSRSETVLENELKRKGYKVVSPVLYVTDPRSSLDEEADKLIHARKADCIAFTAPSSVTAMRSLLGAENLDRLLKNVTIAAIDPVTTLACADAGLPVEIQPADYTLQAMARAIARHFGYSIASTTISRSLMTKNGNSHECQY